MEERRLHVVVEPAERAGTVPVPTDSAHEAVKQPAYGVRADSPGPRGCWATKRDGDPCSAPSRRDGDYCAAHSGLGIAQNPAEFSKQGVVASAESRTRRATLRLALGQAGFRTPRGVLKAAVWAEAERVAAAALSPIGDSSLGSAAKQRAALALIDATDPQPKAAELTITEDLDAEGIAGMGLAQLRALAERVGLDPSPSSPLPLSS